MNLSFVSMRFNNRVLSLQHRIRKSANFLVYSTQFCIMVRGDLGCLFDGLVVVGFKSYALTMRPLR